MTETLSTERDGRVLTVLIDAPPHKFIGRRMVEDLDELTRSLARDRSLRAIVLTGARPGLFVTHYEILAVERSSLRGLLEGRTLPPAEAHAVGLVHGLAPAARLLATEAAHRLARRSPQAVAALKRSVASEGGSPWADAGKLRPWQRGEVVDLGPPA